MRYLIAALLLAALSLFPINQPRASAWQADKLPYCDLSTSTDLVASAWAHLGRSDLDKTNTKYVIFRAATEEGNPDYSVTVFTVDSGAGDSLEFSTVQTPSKHHISSNVINPPDPMYMSQPLVHFDNADQILSTADSYGFVDNATCIEVHSTDMGYSPWYEGEQYTDYPPPDPDPEPEPDPDPDPAPDPAAPQPDFIQKASAILSFTIVAIIAYQFRWRP